MTRSSRTGPTRDASRSPARAKPAARLHEQHVKAVEYGKKPFEYATRCTGAVIEGEFRARTRASARLLE